MTNAHAGKSKRDEVTLRIAELERTLNSSESIRHAEKDILIKEIETSTALRERARELVRAGETLYEYWLENETIPLSISTFKRLLTAMRRAAEALK